MKPMLAYNKEVDLGNLPYPMLISPKLDGIRCIIVEGVPLSRSLKQIPNKHVQNMLYDEGLEGFDGELMVNGDFNSVQSAIMSFNGEPDFTYHVFDLVDCPAMSFEARQSELFKRYAKLDELTKLIVKLVPQEYVTDWVRAQIAARKHVAAGYEGSIIRCPRAKYKFGRSTLREAGMIKVIEWYRTEAIVTGVEELLHNTNEATINEVGRSVRSHAQEGQVGGNKLGALCCKLITGTEFKIGTGFDDAQRVCYWGEDLIGKTVTFKYKSFTKYGVPREPVFIGFRHPDDM